MPMWYIDSGAGFVHKASQCAERTGQSTGGRSPFCKIVSSQHSPGWRQCGRCVNQIRMASAGSEDDGLLEVGINLIEK